MHFTFPMKPKASIIVLAFHHLFSFHCLYFFVLNIYFFFFNFIFQTLAPEWKAAAETFDKNDKIILAAVDATVSPDLAKR